MTFLVPTLQIKDGCQATSCLRPVLPLQIVYVPTGKQLKCVCRNTISILGAVGPNQIHPPKCNFKMAPRPHPAAIVTLSFCENRWAEFYEIKTEDSPYHSRPTYPFGNGPPFPRCLPGHFLFHTICALTLLIETS
jgi:hypothetical protein